MRPECSLKCSWLEPPSCSKLLQELSVGLWCAVIRSRGRRGDSKKGEGGGGAGGGVMVTKVTAVGAIVSLVIA